MLGVVNESISSTQKQDHQANESISSPPGPVTGSSGVIASKECGKCQKKFRYKHKLKKHMYGCGCKRFPHGTHCDERFKTMYNRRRHLENLDSTTCKECGKEFKGGRGVKRHMKKLHSEKKAEKCEYCMREFTETYMKRYIKLKHSNLKVLEATYEEGGGFECNTCGGGFDGNIALQKHMKRH